MGMQPFVPNQNTHQLIFSSLARLPTLTDSVTVTVTVTVTDSDSNHNCMNIFAVFYTKTHSEIKIFSTFRERTRLYFLSFLFFSVIAYRAQYSRLSFQNVLAVFFTTKLVRNCI